MDANVNPADGGQPLDSLSALLDHVIDRNGYGSLHELASHTTIPYKTLYAIHKGTRNRKRPPTVEWIQTFARDFGMPEATVFRAAGRAYSDPGSLDSLSLELLELFKALPHDDQQRAIRIVAMLLAISPDKRPFAEGVIRGIVATDKAEPAETR
jgi:hypothetical protein